MRSHGSGEDDSSLLAGRLLRRYPSSDSVGQARSPYAHTDYDMMENNRESTSYLDGDPEHQISFAFL